MSVHLNLLISDELNEQIESVAKMREVTKAELFRKAIALYVAASEGHDRGLRFGLVKSSQAMETEIVGL